MAESKKDHTFGTGRSDKKAADREKQANLIKQGRGRAAKPGYKPDRSGKKGK